jgi:hypothetical protein
MRAQEFGGAILHFLDRGGSAVDLPGAECCGALLTRRSVPPLGGRRLRSISRNI